MKFSQYKSMIFHCGIHKTGSSYLQHTLKDNTAVLRRHDIYFPTDPHPYFQATGNHSAIALEYVPDADVEDLFQRMEFVGSTCKTLLVSGEEFARKLPVDDFLPKLIRASGDAHLRFVFYLRRHDHLRESIYAESVKSHQTGDINGTEFQFDYFETLRPFVEAVGLQNVITRPYNPRLWAQGRLEADFCHAIGFPEMDGELIVPRDKVNESLSREHTFLLSRQKGFPAKERLRNFFAVKSLPSQQGKSKFFMSPEERRQFLLMHAASAQRAGDMFGIADMADFLGADDSESDSEWTPFKPEWNQLADYMADFAQWDGASVL